MAARRSSVIQVLIRGDSSELTNAVGSAETSLGGLGRKAAAATAAVGAALGGLAVVSVREFAKFDQAMTQSLAIMGDVSDALRDEMSDAAREVAKTTTFSAEQAAQSYFFLASAGLDAEASIGAMPMVAKFAQAGMFDMALATDLLTDAQSALGLTIRDDAVANMENMARVSDVLVRANTLANATVQQFSEALTNKAGAALRQLGISVEEGVAVLSAFADQGVKGEYAGTQLGIVLRDLTTKGLKNADAFRALGVRVFDANGEMRAIADIVGDLEGLLGGMSDATQKATLLQLGFSDKSLAAVQALLGQSEAIRNYQAALEDASGFTDQVASKQLESFSAQVELLKSNFIDVAIGIGERLEPALSAVVEFLQAKGPQIEAFVGRVVTGVESFVAAARERGQEFRDVFDERFKQPILDFRDELVGAVERIREKLLEVADEGDRFVRAITAPFRNYNAAADATAFGTQLAESVLLAIDELTELAKPLMDRLKAWVASIDWFKVGADAATYLVQFGVGLLAGFLSFDWVIPLFQSALANWQVVLGAALTLLFAPGKVVGALGKVLAKIPLVGRLLQWFVTAINNLGAGLRSRVGLIFEGFSNGFLTALRGGGPPLVQRFVNFLLALPRALVSIFDDLTLKTGIGFSNFGTAIGNAIRGLVGRLGGLLDNLFAPFRNFGRMLIDDLAALGRNLMGALATGIRNAASAVYSAIRAVARTVWDDISSFWQIRSPSRLFMGLGEDAMRGLEIGIASGANAVVNLTSNVAQTALPSLDFRRQQPVGGQTVVNVTVTSADPEAVVRAIRRYTRVNGPLSQAVAV
jgi:TP901 family phage tail tape measure protein